MLVLALETLSLSSYVLAGYLSKPPSWLLLIMPAPCLLCVYSGAWAIRLWHLTSVVGRSSTRAVRSALGGDEDDVHPAHW